MTNFVNGVLSGVAEVSQGAANLTGNLAVKAENRLTKRKTLPRQIHLADLFRWRLFSKVDFDSVIAYLRNTQILNCENLYTANTIATELIPPVTLEALKYRNPKRALGLYALVGKLCLRRRKGLLCYINLTSGVAKKIAKFDDFLQYVNIPDSLRSESLLLPIEVAFPKLKQALPAAEQGTSYTNPSTTVATQKYLAELPQLQTSRSVKNGQTGVFQDGSVYAVEAFLVNYEVMTSEQHINVARTFDNLLFALLSKLLPIDPSKNINAYIQQVAILMQNHGVRDFTLALQKTDAEIMRSFRELYNLPEGDGSGDTEFQQAILSMWQTVTQTPVTAELSTAYSDLRKRMFEILKQKKEQQAQDDLAVLSQELKATTPPEDILL